MNWLVLVESDLSRQFAMRTHVIELCKALDKFVSINLLSQTPPDELGEHIPYSTTRLPAVSFRPHNLTQMINTMLAYHALKKVPEPINLLYVRLTAFGLGPLFFARQRGILSIVEVNGIWIDEQSLSRRNLPLWKRLMFIPIQTIRGVSLRLACRLAKKVVVVTPQIGIFLESQGIESKKISVVQNGVNPDHFSPMEESTARQGVGLPQDDQLIGFVGSLAAWQGVDLLIEAFSRLRSLATQNTRLLIVGDGSERDNLEKLAKKLDCAESVIFSGFQDYEYIPAFIASCDVLVAPKRPLQSGYSTLKVFEALSCARPVLAARLPGLEIIEQADAGLLFNPEDSDDLGEKLSQILSMSADERQLLGENGRRWVLDNATWDQTAAKIYHLEYP
jgi:glycosyltransferase involved in cell wall biosynthesis